MNYQMLMDTAIRVGEIMLSHGAEAHRVEDTVYRILKTANLETTEVFVIMTGLFATLSDPSMETITVTKRVRYKGNNATMIHMTVFVFLLLWKYSWISICIS